MFIAMLEHEDFPKTDFSHMRTGIMAGSPCPISVMQEVVDKMHMTEITIVYGQTEASPGCTMSKADDPLEVRVNTVGGPLPGVECKIVDPETGEELPDGAPNATREGYQLTGWYDAVHDLTWTDDDWTMPNHDVTYTAQWTANTYTISFDAGEGSGEMTDQTFTYDEEVTNYFGGKKTDTLAVAGDSHSVWLDELSSSVEIIDASGSKGDNLLAERYQTYAGFPMPKATFMGGVRVNL
jgi:uncharacterized repeat protein (TIGR02543 family)